MAADAGDGAAGPTSTHEVLGTRITMPVRIRSAHAFMATYLVSANAVQRLIDYSGLRALRLPGGRALCTLVFVQYVDGDLGPYHEFGVSFMVDHHTASPGTPVAGLGSLLAGSAGVFIHRLPVDGEFTLAAGRGIWGFPKELAEFDVTHRAIRHGSLRRNGTLVVDLTVRPGLRTPMRRSAGASFDAYSHIDGVTRCTRWGMAATGMRARLGGAELILGEHPWADELASLGLPRRAISASSVENLAMTFGDAVVV